MVTRVRRSSHDLCRRLNTVIFFSQKCSVYFASLQNSYFVVCPSNVLLNTNLSIFQLKIFREFPNATHCRTPIIAVRRTVLCIYFFYFILMINIVIVSLFAHTVFTFCIMSVVFSVTVLHKVSFSLNLHTNQLAVIPIHKH